MNKKIIAVSISAVAGVSFVLNLAAASFFLSGKPSTSKPQPLSQEKVEAIAPIATVSPTVPKDTCGDSYDPAALAWYPVFLDSGNVKTVQSTLCLDAQDITRKDTGKRSVQVASFTNYDRALAYAKSIHATVGQPTIIAKASPVFTTPLTPPLSPTPPSREIANPLTQQGSLTSRDHGAPINVRDDASPQAHARHIGYAGDPVRIGIQKTGSDGQRWYRVTFNSGAEGWVRNDFVAVSATPSNVSPALLESSTHGTSSYLSSGSGSGLCNSPNSLDSAGRRCGDRAASVRSGGSTVGSYRSTRSSSSYRSTRSSSGSGSVHVRSYTRRDGTRVRAHTRSRGRR
jgi:hypothetical protein